MKLRTTSCFTHLLHRAFKTDDSFQVIRDLSASLFSLKIAAGPPFDPEEYAQHFKVHIVECNIPTPGFLTTVGRFRAHISTFSKLIKVKGHSDLQEFHPGDFMIAIRTLPEAPTRTEVNRRRFTIAHEFAHWYLRDSIQMQLDRAVFKNDDPDEEQLCDLFAAELLVPTKMFLEDLTQPGFTLSVLLGLTTKYGVSLPTLLVKTGALSKNYAAFGLFSRNVHQPEVFFTTPVRQRNLFCDRKVFQDVERTFQSNAARRCKYTLDVNGTATPVEANYIPIQHRTGVLSFIHTEPFQVGN